MRTVVDRALVEVRITAGVPERRERVTLSRFIGEAQIVAAIEAEARGLELTVAPVESALVVEVDRHILAGALANLLHNAFKFTRPHGRILLKAYSAGDRILIDVEDECGGLNASASTESMLRRPEHGGIGSTGLGLGLVISRRAVEANAGRLRVRNRSGVGCVFTVDLPQAPPPASS